MYSLLAIPYWPILATSPLSATSPVFEAGGTRNELAHLCTHLGAIKSQGQYNCYIIHCLIPIRYTC